MMRKIVGLAGKQTAFKIISLFDVFLRQDGTARRHTPDQRQRELGQALKRQRKLLHAGIVKRPQCVAPRFLYARVLVDRHDDTAGTGFW